MFSEGLGLLARPIEALADGFNNFVNGIGNFFSNLISSLGSWFSDVISGIVNLGSSIGQWFTNLINSIGQWFANVINGISDFANSVANWFGQVFATIGEILEHLNPFSEKFFLRIALIPSDGYFERFANDIKQSFDGKFAFISEIGDVLKSLFSGVYETDPEPPEFAINLPGGKWGEGRVKVIDFSIFAEYRQYILNLIRVMLWIPFLIKLYKRLPNIVYK